MSLGTVAFLRPLAVLVMSSVPGPPADTTSQRRETRVQHHDSLVQVVRPNAGALLVLVSAQCYSSVIAVI